MTDQFTAVDVAHWAGDISTTTWKRVLDAGVSRVVCGTQNHARTRQQLVAARLAGCSDREAYTYVYFAGNAAEQVRRDVALVKPLGVKRLWIDCEDVVPGMTQDEYVRAIAGAVAIVEAGGLEAGIYTARWWWLAYTGNSSAFKDRAWWTAQWDGVDDLARVTRYGGWTTAAMKQYRPSTPAEVDAGGVHFPDKNGVWCDVNVFALPLSPPMRADDPALIYFAQSGQPARGATVKALPMIERSKRRYEVELPA